MEAAGSYQKEILSAKGMSITWAVLKASDAKDGFELRNTKKQANMKAMKKRTLGKCWSYVIKGQV